jgi:hypothetical protein
MMAILAETFFDFKNVKILNFKFWIKNWQVFARKTVNWSQLNSIIVGRIIL